MITAKEALDITNRVVGDAESDRQVNIIIDEVDKTVRKLSKEGKYMATLGFKYADRTSEQMAWIKYKVTQTLAEYGYKVRWKTFVERLFNKVYAFDNDADTEDFTTALTVSWKGEVNSDEQ